MKKLKKIDCLLKDYKNYQKVIRNVGIGERINLQIKLKENGNKDVFAFDDENNVLGEFFKEDSQELFPFVSKFDQFELKAIIKKIVQKEDDLMAVVVDIEIYAEDNFDENKFLNSFYSSKEASKVVINNSTLESNESNNKVLMGCLYVFIGLMVIVLLIAVFSTSSASSEKNKFQDSLLVKASDSTVVSSSKSIIDSAKINSLKHFFTENKDEFGENTWVKPKSRPVYINQNGFYCYFEKDSKGNVFNFRFVGQYAAEDWLFIKYLKFNIDGNNYDFYPSEVKTDNDTTIWEWFDEEITVSDSSLIEAIAKAKSVKVRFEGSQYYDDRVMSQNTITSIRRTLEYYKSQGGSF